MTLDRRQGISERRVALRVPAVFAVKSFLRGRVQLGQAEDLGTGGMTLRRLPDVPVGTGVPISLTFALPVEGLPPHMLKVHGTVVSDKLIGTFRRTGVRFAPLTDDAVELIRQFCQRLGEAPAYPVDAPLVASG